MNEPVYEKKRNSRKRIIIPLVIALLAAIAVLAVYNWCIKPHVEEPVEKPAETAISAENTSEKQVTEEWRTVFADYFKDIEKNNKYESISDYMSAYIVDLDCDNIPEVVGNWYGSYTTIVAYYDNGVIKEAKIPLDYWDHSTDHAGDYPRQMYFDTQKNIIAIRNEARNDGVLPKIIAVAYKYNHGDFEEYKIVSFDASQEEFSDLEREEKYNAIKNQFEDRFKEFSEEFNFIDFNDSAFYYDVPVYISKYFYNSDSYNLSESKVLKSIYEVYADKIKDYHDNQKRYAIFDLDHDGTAELLIEYGFKFNELKTDIFRYDSKTGECNFIGTIDGRGTLYSEPTGNVFYNDVAFHGHARIYKCFLDYTYVGEILLFQVANMEEYEGTYGEYKPDYAEPYKEGNTEVEFTEIDDETPDVIRALGQ